MKEKNNLRERRGAISDLFVFLVSAFVFVLIIVLLVFALTTAYSGILGNASSMQDALIEGNATTIITDSVGQAPTAYNLLPTLMVVLVVGMILSILVTSFLIRVHPVFFVPYIFIWIISIIVAVPLSNTYETIYETAVLTSTFAQFSGVSFIMLHLPTFIAVIGAIAGIVMFVQMIRSGESTGGFA